MHFQRDKEYWFVLENFSFLPHILQQQPQKQQPHTKQQGQQHFDIPKGIMTTKARLLVLVNRLDHVEKK